MRYPHVTVFLASLGLGLATNAWACSCPAPDLEKIWVDAEHIFVAEIKKVSLVTDASTSANMLASFRVMETLKGKPENVAYLVGTTDNTGSGCAFDFRTGERYLVVTDDAGNVSTCGGSVNLDVGQREPHLAAFYTLYVDMNLEYFRAKVFDANSDCTYSRSGQIAELMRIRDMRPTDWGWHSASAVPSKGEVHFEDEYGQKLIATFGGCHDLGYRLTLLGTRADLTDEEVFGIAITMAEPFWDISELMTMRDVVLQGNFKIEDGSDGRVFLIPHQDYFFEIIYDARKPSLSVGYSRNF